MIGEAWIQKQVQLLGLIVQINLSINPYSRPLNSTAISTCLQHLNRTFINNDDIFSFHPPRAQGSDRSLLNLVNLPVNLHQLKYHAHFISSLHSRGTLTIPRCSCSPALRVPPLCNTSTYPSNPKAVILAGEEI